MLAPVLLAIAALPCPTGSLQPTMHTNGAGGTILIYVGVRKTGPRACGARARVTLALRDAKTRRLPRIKGNPHGRVTPFTLQWVNYCGPPRPLVIEARLGARRVVERSAYPGARCETADVPSRLTVFRLRR
jgi:hypothetical protein